jgi:hypothetical protein
MFPLIDLSLVLRVVARRAQLASHEGCFVWRVAELCDNWQSQIAPYDKMAKSQST